MTKEERLVRAREYRIKHKEEIRAWQKQYNAAVMADPVKHAKKLESNRASYKKHYLKRKKHYINRDKTKYNARCLVRTRIKRGLLQRLPCEVCGEAKAQAHHDDYSKPLDVRWLCPKHHKEVHHVG